MVKETRFMVPHQKSSESVVAALLACLANKPNFKSETCHSFACLDLVCYIAGLKLDDNKLKADDSKSLTAGLEKVCCRALAALVPSLTAL